MKNNFFKNKSVLINGETVSLGYCFTKYLIEKIKVKKIKFVIKQIK